MHYARNVLAGTGDIPGQVPLVLGIWGPKVRRAAAGSALGGAAATLGSAAAALGGAAG